MANEDETIRFLADVGSLVDDLKTHSNPEDTDTIQYNFHLQFLSILHKKKLKFSQKKISHVTLTRAALKLKLLYKHKVIITNINILRFSKGFS